MSTYKIVFSVKQVFHPMTEIISANSVDEAVATLKALVKNHKLSVKQILSIVQQ